MERIAVIADSHADLRATDAVLARSRPRASGGCGAWVTSAPAAPSRSRALSGRFEACELVLAGNHELFVVHRVWKTTDAWWAIAAERAAEELGSARVEQLAELHCHALRSQAELVHGSRTNPAGDFLSDPRAAQRNLELLNRPLLLFGHTHEPACWAPHKNGRWARQEPIMVGEEHPLPDLDARHASRLLNPGAVCDPDGARWLELRLDRDERAAIWHQESVRGDPSVTSLHPPASD